MEHNKRVRTKAYGDGAGVRNEAETSNQGLLRDERLLLAEKSKTKPCVCGMLACERWRNPIVLLGVISGSKTRANKLW